MTDKAKGQDWKLPGPRSDGRLYTWAEVWDGLREDARVRTITVAVGEKGVPTFKNRAVPKTKNGDKVRNHVIHE